MFCFFYYPKHGTYDLKTTPVLALPMPGASQILLYLVQHTSFAETLKQMAYLQEQGKL